MLQIEITTKDPDHAAICELYWQLNPDMEFSYSTKEIAELVNIDVSKIISIAKKSCTASTERYICSDCFKPYVLQSRSDLRRLRRYIFDLSKKPSNYLCNDCRNFRWEAEQEDIRRKEGARIKAQKEAQEELRRKIRVVYDLSNRKPIDIDNLTLTDTIYLISILRGAYEDLTKIKLLSLFEQPLSPEIEFTTEIIDQLLSKDLISPHPDTDPNGFKGGDISVLYIFKLMYAPPISKTSPDDPVALITELHKHLNKEWTEEWRQEALSIWKKVAISECREYLQHALKEHHFEFTPGNKSTQYIEYSLEHFSTAQVFNTIWRSVKDAAAYFQRNRITHNHATNIAIASIQRITERAVVENWSIKPYGRNFTCPQSCVSEVLYNAALKIGDTGFQSVPSIEIINAQASKKEII